MGRWIMFTRLTPVIEAMLNAVKIFEQMRSIFICLIAIGLLSTGWIVSAGQAQEARKCNQDTFGQVACFSVKLCECIYDRGGAMTGLPARYRWDCGILRPRCEEAPTSIIEYRGTPPSYPYAVNIDHYHPKRTVTPTPPNL